MTIGLKNLFGKNKFSLGVEHNEQLLEIPMMVFDRKSNPDVDLFLVFNKYLQFKGEDFQEKLFNLYTKIPTILNNKVNLRTNLRPLPNEIVDEVIEMIDFEDLKSFIVNASGIKIPTSFAETMSNVDMADAKFTEENTYLRNEYIDLLTLITLLKATIVPLAYYTAAKNSELADYARELMLFYFLKENKTISNLTPFKKLEKGVETRVGKSTTKIKGQSTLVGNKNISIDDIPNYYTGLVIAKKLFISNLYKESNEYNIVKSFYSYLNQKLTHSSSDLKNTIKPSYVNDGADEDSISMMERFNITTDLPPGFIVEVNWCVDSLEKILPFLCIELPYEEVESVYQTMLKYDYDIKHSQMALLGMIFREIAHPNSYHNLNYDNMMRLMATGTVMLKYLGFPKLALLASAYVPRSEDMAISNVKPNNNVSNIPEELKSKMDVYFPYHKPSKRESENLAVSAITNLSKFFNAENWEYVLSEDMVLVEGMEVVKNEDVKISLLKLAILLEEKIYNDSI